MDGFGADGGGVGFGFKVWQAAHRIGEGFGVAGGEPQPVNAFAHHCADIAKVARNHRRAHRVGLGRHKGEALVTKARGQSGPAFGQQRAERFVGNLAEELDIFPRVLPRPALERAGPAEEQLRRGRVIFQ